MTRISRFVLVGACAALLGGPALAERANAPLPPPDAADASQGLASYRIGPMDKLSVTVFEVKDLTGPVDVDSAGRITLPLVGSVQAVGLTTTDVSKEIADRLRQGYVKDPVVTVTVTDAVSQKVTVGGAVQKPGVYPITAHTTLTTAIALAEGADPQRANERQVRLIRTVGGKRMQVSYNLLDIQRGKVADPEVYGSDTIIVGTSSGRSLLRDLATASPLLYLFSVW